jgi:guanylate kinase
MKKIILIWESAGGKDYLMSGLVKLGLKPCLKTTTRPIRDNEFEGISYHYTTNECFNSIKNDMIVYQRFDLNINNENKIWYYGIEISQYQLGQVCIMTPSEVNSLSPSIRNDAHVIYVNIDDKIRRERLQARVDTNDSIDRRIKSDYMDFKDFSNFDTIISDPMFIVDDVFKALGKQYHL